MATMLRYRDDHYRATPQSIQRAKEEARKEREAIYEKTGVRITDQGAILPPVTMACPCRGCQWAAHGRSELGVVRSVAAHYKRVHLSAIQE